MNNKQIKIAPDKKITKMKDLETDSVIHLAGVGGSAMNGLALILKSRGYRVEGTDPRPSAAIVKRLEQNGITVHTTQDGSKISSDAKLLITTAALPMDHPELVTAATRNIPIIKYADMLGFLLNDSKGIAVAGTHGKTTTTAFAVVALKYAGVNPGFLAGSVIGELDSSASAGDSSVFVAEACEYDRSFLRLKPQRAIITNIEADHLDIYSDLNEIIETFTEFVARIPSNGTLFYNADCANTRAVATRTSVRTVSFSCDGQAHVQARNISHSNKQTGFDLYVGGKLLGTCSIKLPGRHNIYNALGALAVGLDMGLSAQELIVGVSSLKGIKRRFEIIGIRNGVTIIDDYAHHPTEIRALLKGASQRYTGHRLIVAFQPHQLSRTRLFFNDFASAFKDAHTVLLTDIFTARDEDARDKRYSSLVLASKICDTGTFAEFCSSFDELIARAKTILNPGDVFITVGAGDIYKAAKTLLNSL